MDSIPYNRVDFCKQIVKRHKKVAFFIASLVQFVYNCSINFASGRCAMDYAGLALFTDLDRTLFNHSREVSPKNRQALELFQREGGLFGIATGRAPMNALGLLPRFPMNTWSVVLNGAEAYNFSTGTAAFPRLLPQILTATFLGYVLEKLPQVNVLLCSESRIFFLSPQALADRDFLLSHRPCTFTGLETALGYPWLKVLFCAPRPVLEALERTAAEMDLFSAVDRVYTGPVYLEFLPKGVHKGRCLGDLRCLDALRGRKMIAVGDWTNDIELLDEADLAAAVDNALPEVKTHADILLPSNEEDAIAHLIYEVIPSL